ncbi:Retrovirus-related Pol Polyprotein [Phytophthora palmivora]|uniref:Retrovirus-related Pol Polyprotein n=1 Tax=Phytophthora palmivora TaxID=4796 RepID=A0A2P4X1U1_9STRA|nr:Retrovirus-related Pol Polyprotein [Phytophthora palmivora]
MVETLVNIGHIQVNCPCPRRDDSESESQLPERKRWKNKKKPGKTNAKQRDIDMISRCDNSSKAGITQSSMENGVEWILDSASDCHVCTNKEILTNLRQDDGPLVFDWEGKSSKSSGLIGKVNLQVKNENQPDVAVSLCLGKVLYTASGMNNLLSLDKLEKDGWEFVKLRKQKNAWLHKQNVMLKLVKARGRYRLQSTVTTGRQVEAVEPRRRDDELALVRWHARLGHLNFGALQQMVRDKTVEGMELSGSVQAPEERCWTCVQAKLKRMSYKRVSTDRSRVPYQKLVSDECFLGEPTYNGERKKHMM